MKHVKPIDPVSTWHLLNENEKDAIYYVSSLLKANRKNDQYEQYWFPTPENPGDEDSHTPIQRRILQELRNLQEPEQLNPQNDDESRRKFLGNFDWKDSMLQQHEIKKIESLLVEYHDVFARHRFDIGMNEEFTVKLTPKDDSPAYSESLPTPVNLKEDILVELALLHKYNNLHNIYINNNKLHNNYTAIFEIRQSHICTEKTEWEAKTTSRPEEN